MEHVFKIIGWALNVSISLSASDSSHSLLVKRIFWIQNVSVAHWNLCKFQFIYSWYIVSLVLDALLLNGKSQNDCWGKNINEETAC